MFDTGLVLYVLLVAILMLFLRAAGRPSLEKMLDQNVHAHEHVHRVLAKHPGGGRWTEVKRWLAEDAEPARVPPTKDPAQAADAATAAAPPASPPSK